MGETVMDILFRNGQPFASNPGGSSFNSAISIGRSGIPCSFVGYTGDDHIGKITADFLKENGVDTTYFEERKGSKSSLALAYLNEKGDADYCFYKDNPTVSKQSLELLPEFCQGDALLYGSNYAMCEGMRPQVLKVLKSAKEAGATVYYDINFRPSHRHEREQLKNAIEENMSLSTIVRGSADDFEVLWDSRDARQLYENYIKKFCKVFICTAGEELITVCTPQATWNFNAPRIPKDKLVSTVGAGDNFNAGILCQMVRNEICAEDLTQLSFEQWESLIQAGTHYASMVCQSSLNYITSC